MSARQFKSKITVLCLTVIIMVFATPACLAGVDFDYDIFIQKDTVSLWVDITPVLTQPRLEDLLAGLDIYVGLDFSLETKGTFGIYKNQIRHKTTIIISHKLIDDIYRLKILPNYKNERRFDNLMQLRQFLADSLVFAISPEELLPPEKPFRLSFDLMAKSGSYGLLGISIEGHLDDEKRSEEIQFLENVFSQFLKIIGFGRSAYHVESPRFIIKDLPDSSP